MYAMESPDIRFYDEGRAKLNNGIANISLNPIFRETIEDNFNVYLTPEGKTKAIYVAEKAKEYFIVKDTAATNAVFSYIISGLRKGYAGTSLDLERKTDTDIEITALIDEHTASTEIEINAPLSLISPQSIPLTESAAQSAQQSAIQPQSTQETQQNTTQNSSALVISGGQTTSNIGDLPQPNSVAVTGNVINEAGLETDLTKILDNSSTITQGNLGSGTSPDDSASSPDAAIAQNNLINETNNNATSVTETIQEQPEEQEDDEKEEVKAIQISESKFTINSIDEEEIIEKIQEKTKLDTSKSKICCAENPKGFSCKDKIKRAITFKKKEPVKDEFEEEEEEFEEEFQPAAPSIVQLGYIEKVNGSVIIRLG